MQAQAQSMRNGRDESPGSKHQSKQYAIGQAEAANTDKAILNLMKEHNKLKRRLEVVS